MTSTIRVIKKKMQNNHIVVGENTLNFIESLKMVEEDDKANIIDEAMDVLSHCIKPGVRDNITNIAVGYVQSGKTLSFTTLTALAADNGYRIIIYLTGTKTNLEKQTSNRLNTDLDLENTDVYRLLPSVDDELNFGPTLKSALLHGKDVLLIPILKHYKHINTLANTLNSVEIADLVKAEGAIIIDDEADQASFNTLAKKNASSPDWIEDDFSSTYSSILALKKALPSHSYIQYTATPQAAFLIDNSDILSPTYHTVLTPGKGYTGGGFFFKNKTWNLIKIIPENELYHYKRNPLTTKPKSLEEAVMEFLISVAIVVFIQKRPGVRFLSMMIHVDGRCDTNRLFSNWVTNMLSYWEVILFLNDNDPGKRSLTELFHKAYTEITRYVENKPTFTEVMNVMRSVISRRKISLVQSDASAGDNIEWNTAKAHFLIGADMLNRGFTIEKLSMTYMPRTTQGKANADTIEQRCRFLGYKKDYADVCRIYLSQKSLIEYQDYVDHEDVLRTSLSACSTIEEFNKRKDAMMLADSLNPTRTNILSTKLVRYKLSGWRQMPSLDCIEDNKNTFMDFLSSIDDILFTNCENYNDNVVRNHRWTIVSTDRFIEFLKKVKYEDYPNITRKIVTIQYLLYLRDTLNIKQVCVFEMAYKAGEQGKLRKRGIKDGKPNNLQAGRADNESYPGDTKFFSDRDLVSVQIHHIKLENTLGVLNGKDLFNLCIYYPEKLANSFVGLEEDDEDK